MRLLRIEIFTCLVVMVSTFPQSETMENQEQIELIILQSAAEPHVTTNDKEINTVSKVLTESLSHQTTKYIDNIAQENPMDNSHLLTITTTTNSENFASNPIELIFHTADKENILQSIKNPISMSHSIPRALENDEYLVFALGDVDSSELRLKKLHIIPRDYMINSNSKILGRNVDDGALETEEEEEGRMIKMHKLKKYVRRLMRMIRKGTRKVTKATFLRAAVPLEE